MLEAEGADVLIHPAASGSPREVLARPWTSFRFPEGGPGGVGGGFPIRRGCLGAGDGFVEKARGQARDCHFGAVLLPRGDQLIAAPVGDPRPLRRVGPEAAPFGVFWVNDPFCKQSVVIDRPWVKTREHRTFFDEGASRPEAEFRRFFGFRVAADLELRVFDIFEQATGRDPQGVEFGVYARRVAPHIHHPGRPEFKPRLGFEGPFSAGVFAVGVFRHRPADVFRFRRHRHVFGADFLRVEQFFSFFAGFFELDWAEGGFGRVGEAFIFFEPFQGQVFEAVFARFALRVDFGEQRRFGVADRFLRFAGLRQDDRARRREVEVDHPVAAVFAFGCVDVAARVACGRVLVGGQAANRPFYRAVTEAAHCRRRRRWAVLDHVAQPHFGAFRGENVAAALDPWADAESSLKSKTLLKPASYLLNRCGSSVLT